jgi:release factor glutamine methyltransferase
MTETFSVWRELWEETAEAVGDRTVARWLCEEASGLEGEEFLDALDEVATMRMGLSLQSMVGRVLAGEPVQYVIGHWPFRHVDLLVDTRVLIPRPETELVAEVALEMARSWRRERGGADTVVVADLGTGSGAIGLSLASELPITGVEVWITDLSSDALDVARANISGIGRNAANVRVAQGSWCEALPEERRRGVHVIVSNPPYIDQSDPEVDGSVREWEPASALFASNDGLADIETIVAQARDWLVEGGWLVLEIGHRQGDAVRRIFVERGYVDVEIRRDLAQRDRIAIARLMNAS